MRPLKKMFFSKKGVVLLTMASLAFLLTVFLLAEYRLDGKYSAEKSLSLFDISNRGEEALLYIDQAVKIALFETWNGKSRKGTYSFSVKCNTSDLFNTGCRQDFLVVFNSNFNRKLKNFNLLFKQKLNDRDFKIDIKALGKTKIEGFKISGNAKKQITFESENIKYKLYPNFYFEKLNV